MLQTFTRSFVGLFCIGFLATTLLGGEIPGTKPLTIEGPLDKVMVSGIDKFCLRELAVSVERRKSKWHRDYSSHEAYDKSVTVNRERLRTIIGAVDPRVKSADIELITTLTNDSVVGSIGTTKIHAVRWQVMKGMTAEGLLFQPENVVARAVALPDADDEFGDLGPESYMLEWGTRLAANGVQVLSPVIINRDTKLSGSPYVAYTNQPQREFIYRMAFEMGRHIIGYEVQKVLAAVDIFEQANKRENKDLPIGVAGIGEGGLIAFYSAAIDTRIDAVIVSGYFQPRENLWKEPIYRNVWALLREFGDADIASLVAPRFLAIEDCEVEEVEGPANIAGRRGGSAPGAIRNPSKEDVAAEYGRAKVHFEKLKAADNIVLHHAGRQNVYVSSKLNAAGKKFIAELIGKEPSAQPLPDYSIAATHAAGRQERQFNEMVDFTQDLLRLSSKVRDKKWAKLNSASKETWEKTAQEYRDMVYNEMIGRLPKPTIPPNVRTRQVMDEPEFRAWEVVIDVYPDVIAQGILLFPKDLKPNEKRPVVVCQHGLEGVPMDTITRTGNGFRYYKAFAAELAKQGFITYAPQNPYRGRDEFRTLQRKSNPLKRSLFSYIIPQHERTLEWLSTLPNVDPKRIAFYGLSYGGKTAVRVPPMVKQYCLSICSADFNEWIVKNTTNEHRHSYIFTGEYEIFEWNMGHMANYAELSKLMTPRPFMVERGHDDGVAPDEWVAWEYSKVRRHYVKLGLGDKTEIEFFNGPHSINGVGTYAFLKKHLNWK
ncbi:MAG: hypothetical protein CMJ78_01325 [Planctomycetaceae bacterium]|nr:hypothetical protein [Planctomycetaceae bacterium]